MKKEKTLSTEEKERLLEKTRKSAKVKFRGIDKQIDMFIDAITGWYLYPNLQTKPTIVNLWGLTGVGKTTLARYILHSLGMGGSYKEILVQNDTNKYNNNMSNELRFNELQEPYAILLDEFQRYTTVNEFRKPKETISYLDLWSLLSDGILYNPKIMRIYFKEYLYKLVFLKVYLINALLKTVVNDECSSPLNIPKLDYTVDSEETELSLSDIEKKVIGEHLGGNNHLYKKSFEELMEEIKNKESLSLNEQEVVKYKLHNLAVDVTKISFIRVNSAQISLWTWEDIYNTIVENFNILSSKVGMDALKAKKLLIIIAGNRDELYTSADSMYLTYKDVDSVYEETKDFKWYQLRNLLLDSLSPEQINRLGMTHILFPSLSSKAYKQIIKDKLNSISKSYKKEFDIYVKFTPSFEEAVYKNSVFPVQGVRPVLSFIEGLVSSTLLKHITIKDKKSKSVELSIDEKESKLIIKSDKKVTSYPVVLEVSERENSIPEECRLTTAAHEAGHAITGMFLWDCISTIDMAPMLDGVAGLTSPQKNDKTENSIGSLHKYFKGYLCMLLSGKAAEELVFGQENASVGCSSDMRTATNIVFKMIRKWGLSSNIVSSSSSDFNSTLSKTTNLEQEDLQAEYILNEEYGRAKDIITLLKPVFIEMVEYLKDHSFMDKYKAQEFLKKVKKIRSSNSLSSYSEKKLWKKFKGEK